MSLRIFDNEAPSKARQDVVGTLRSGRQLQGRPVSLPTWRFTTGDPEVAEYLARAFGGEVASWDTKTEEVLEVITDAEVLEVLVDRITSEMVLWGRNGKIRSCDGVTQKDDARSPCACPQSMADRKDAAQQGTGCEPSVGVFFRLADYPELGQFKFFSGAWSFARDIGKPEAALEALEGKPGRGLLGKEEVTMKDGRTFTKPTLVISGPASEGDEEEAF